MQALPEGFIDGRSVTGGTVFEADVCVIGGGPVGLSIAGELAARGLSVCLVESGGFEYDAAEHDLCHGELAGNKLVDPHVTRTRQYGGLSNNWNILFDRPRVGVRYVPMDPIDFQARKEVPYSGWPFDHTEMAPWYERAQVVCGIGPFRYDAEYRATAEQPAFESEDRELHSSLFQFGPSSRFHSATRTTLAQTGRVQALLHTTGLALETSEDERHIERLQTGCLNGRRFAVRARSYVLAAGATENARLLLLSNNRNPAGVGNRHDLVGRFLMDHPLDGCSYIKPSDHGVYDRLKLFDLQVENGVGYMAKLTFSDPTIRKHKLLNMTFILVPCEALQMKPSVAAFRTIVKGTSRFAPPKGRMAQLGAMVMDPVSIVRHVHRVYSYPGAVSSLGYGGWSQLPDKAAAFSRIDVWNQIEQYPHPDNRVQLGESIDAFGQRRIKYDFTWRDEDQNRFIHSQRHFAGLTEKAGLGTYHFDDTKQPGELSSHHAMGTTRMHEDPRQGVVDPNCRVHGTDNLFAATASVFPTGGYANPTLTAIAMGLRLAAFLAAVVPFLDIG